MVLSSLCRSYTIAVECIATYRAEILPTVPGLPDDAFVHDGQLTKKIVRSATLSALMPMAGQVLWDLGAGCGLSLLSGCVRPGNKGGAVERDQERLSSIAANAQALGTPFLSIKEGELLSVLGELMKQEQRPDAIFVGGGPRPTGCLISVGKLKARRSLCCKRCDAGRRNEALRMA